MITFIYGKLLYSYKLYANTNQKSSKLKFIDHFFASYCVDSKRRKSLYAENFFFCIIPRNIATLNVSTIIFIEIILCPELLKLPQMVFYRLKTGR